MYATEEYEQAIAAVRELLSKLRLDFIFVGNVARAAWLGGEVATGSIDVLALMSPEQKNSVAMMASNRGFRVDRAEIEQSEELDLVPLNLGAIKIHVLVASNALYGRMVAAGVVVDAIKVPVREDFALLLAMSGDDVALHALTGATEFDRARYNEKVASIGLTELTLSQ
jgi:hypothetical protein